MTSDVLITCPKCSTVLDRKVVVQVEVDLCPSCGGIWLDPGELERLKQSAHLRDVDLLRQFAGEGRRVPPTSRAVKLPCPVCEGRLTALELGEVAIDVCESCRGIWLDRGELQATLAILAVLAPKERTG
jgi:hypothetical protein